MKRILFPVLGLVLIAASVYAQSAQPTLYAEAVHKGTTRITEDKFQVELNPDDATYRQRVRDSAGNERYEFAIVPKIPEGDTKITSWQVTLRDLRHPYYGNLLQFDPEPSEDPKDNLFWLHPKSNAPVPIRARRIIKVEAFYVVFQVRNFHFTPVGSPYLDSMTVQFEFSNRDPRNTAPE